MGWKFSDLVPLLHRDQGVVESPGCEGGSSSKTPGYGFLTDEELSKLERKLPNFQLGSPLKKDHSSSGPLPCCSDPTIQHIQEALKKGRYTVKIRKGTKKKNLFRFLLAKLIYEEQEGLHLDEFLVLWELLLNLQELSLREKSFSEKHGDFFSEVNYEFFERLSTRQEFPIRLEADPEDKEVLRQMFSPLLPSKSAYFGLKGQKGIRSGFLISFTDQLPIRKLPEGRRIGVGYRDKGSRRDLSKDGSPDWREVSQNSQEMVIRAVETLTCVSRDDPTFNWDLVNNPTEFQVEKRISRKNSTVRGI